jgi:signal transduction histidine kinase
MERMVNDLDDYSVSQIRGLLPVARQRVELRAICDEVVRAMQVTYPDRTFELEPGLELAASVDPMRIRQVLTNLLNNAMTYGDPRRPVLLAIHRVTGGFEMTISNEGAPIPEHIIPTLFQPFRRGPGTGSAQQRGHMGLGLYIVQQIVQAHEGGISVESTPRRTRFTIFIPFS